MDVGVLRGIEERTVFYEMYANVDRRAVCIINVS